MDEDTAWIVRKIFDWSAHGYGDKKIQKLLYQEKIPTPACILYRKYGIYGQVFEGQPEDKQYRWGNGAVRTILSNQLYLGHTVTFKTGVISYKNPRQVAKPEDEWIIVRDTHEPIISEEQFELVQRLHRGRIRKTKTTSEPHILAGITKCADCHASMKYNVKLYEGKNHTTQTEYLYCMTYATFGKERCLNHYINYGELTEVILKSIRSLAKRVTNDEQGMLKLLLTVGSEENAEKERQFRSESTKLTKRKAQLDAVFLKLYEDRATGNISEENYKLVSRNFEREKAEVELLLTEITDFLKNREQEQIDITRWVALIKKYKDIDTLDCFTANELLDKVYIGHPKIVDGVRTQKIDIYYRFVGNLDDRL